MQPQLLTPFRGLSPQTCRWCAWFSRRMAALRRNWWRWLTPCVGSLGLEELQRLQCWIMILNPWQRSIVVVHYQKTFYNCFQKPVSNICILWKPWQDGPNGQKIPKQFRYQVVPKSKVNCFKPKKLEGDTTTVRYSQFGAIFDMFRNLPSTSNFGIVWEVFIGIKTSLVTVVILTCSHLDFGPWNMLKIFTAIISTCSFNVEKLVQIVNHNPKFFYCPEGESFWRCSSGDYSGQAEILFQICDQCACQNGSQGAVVSHHGAQILPGVFRVSTIIYIYIYT